MIKQLVRVYVVAVCLVLAGCGGQWGGDKDENKSVPGKPIRPEQYDIMTYPGATFSFALPAKPSIDYRWQLARPLDENILVHEGTVYEHRGAQAKIPGGGVEKWNFKAIGEGTAQVELLCTYKIPGSNKARVRTVNVKVASL